MTATKVFLHLGEPKCGTTFLQNLMWNNQALLADNGVTLPGSGIDDHYRAAQDLRDQVQAAEDPGALWAGTWSIVAKLAREASNVAVISHEFLVGANDEQIARAVESLADAEVHVIVTSRDFASLLPAEWQETVKHRNSRSWYQWLNDIIDTPVDERRPRAEWFWAAHDTPGILARWATVLAPERVHLVTVPPSGAPADLLWKRFASVLGIGDLQVDLSTNKSNASLGVTEVELLRRVNARLPELPMWFYSRHVKSVIAHGILAERPKTHRLGLPQGRHAWVRAQSEARLEAITALGIDIVGSLDELAVPAEFPAGIMPAEVTDAELLDAAIDALAGLIERRYENAMNRPGLRSIMTDAAPGWFRNRALARLRPTAERLGLAARRRHG